MQCCKLEKHYTVFHKILRALKIFREIPFFLASLAWKALYCLDLKFMVLADGLLAHNTSKAKRTRILMLSCISIHFFYHVATLKLKIMKSWNDELSF